GNETTLPVLDVGERPEAVELQLEQPVAMVEGIAAPRQRERRDIGEGARHQRSIRATVTGGSRWRAMTPVLLRALLWLRLPAELLLKRRDHEVHHGRVRMDAVQLQLPVERLRECGPPPLRGPLRS